LSLLKTWIFQIPTLIRFWISLAVTFSAATGYIVSSGKIDSNFVFIITGVFLLAGGASALNQFQERKTDALMERTKNRPIPSGKVSPLAGLIFSEIICLTGFFILLMTSGPLPALLGLFNLIWYNGLYTYLKKKTAFAVVPGSLTGVVPVFIGWTAAGGYLLNPTLIFISFFIFMWQIPHFWLLLIRYNDDYKKAGLGYLYRSLSKDQIKRLIFVWIITTSFTSLFFPYFGIIRSPFPVASIVLLNIILIVVFYIVLFKKSEQINYRLGFLSINIFLILNMIFLLIEKLTV